MATRGLGIDEGSASIKVAEVEKREGAYVPVRAAAVPTQGESGANVEWNPAALQSALSEAGIKGRTALLGLTGKDLVVKYQQVPPVADFQLKKIVEFELAEIKKQSGDELAADFNVMPVRADLTSDDIVLLALTREQRIAERSDRLKQAKISARYFTPNAVALFHAFRVFGPASSGDVLIASIGRSCSDFAVMRDGDLLYARSVSVGGDLLTDAIAQEFNVSKAKAESLKRELGDLRPRDRRSGLSQQAEKVSYALEGAAGRLFSTVQSTLQLAKSQMQMNQLNVTKVWLTGGCAAMKGLDDYLAASLAVPVQRFDPLADAGVAVTGEAESVEMTVALGLAAMAADADSWSVQVIGAGERKRREFVGKHLFTIAAIVLVCAYLGLAYFRWDDQHKSATQVATKLRAERDKRQRNSATLEKLRIERADLAARVDLLEKRKAAGDGLLRSLELLVTHLPEDLWVGNLDLEFEETPGTAPGGSREKGTKRPVIVVDGAGKSRGTRNVDEAYTEFVTKIEALPETADEKPGDVLHTQNPGREKFEYRLRLTWLTTPKPPADESGTETGDR